MSTPVMTVECTALGSDAAPRQCAVHSPALNTFDADGIRRSSLDAGCWDAIGAIGAPSQSRPVHAKGAPNA